MSETGARRAPVVGDRRVGRVVAVVAVAGLVALLATAFGVL